MVVPPVFIVENTTASVGASLHTTWLDGSSTCAAGLTVIVNVFEGPSQLTDPFSK